jgi:hypothetical protein
MSFSCSALINRQDVIMRRVPYIRVRCARRERPEFLRAVAAFPIRTLDFQSVDSPPPGTFWRFVREAAILTVFPDVTNSPRPIFRDDGDAVSRVIVSGVSLWADDSPGRESTRRIRRKSKRGKKIGAGRPGRKGMASPWKGGVVPGTTPVGGRGGRQVGR